MSWDLIHQRVEETGEGALDLSAMSRDDLVGLLRSMPDDRVQAISQAITQGLAEGRDVQEVVATVIDIVSLALPEVGLILKVVRGNTDET